jgi:hypothetical protein
MAAARHVPIDRRNQLIDPDVVAVEQGYDELRESIVGVDPRHAGEEISDIGRAPCLSSAIAA